MTTTTREYTPELVALVIQLKEDGRRHYADNSFKGNPLQVRGGFVSYWVKAVNGEDAWVYQKYSPDRKLITREVGLDGATTLQLLQEGLAARHRRQQDPILEDLAKMGEGEQQLPY